MQYPTPTPTPNDIPDQQLIHDDRLREHLKQHPRTSGLIRNYTLLAVLTHLADTDPALLTEYYQTQK